MNDVECANTTRYKLFLFSEKDRLEYIECGESLLKIKYEIARCDLFSLKGRLESCENPGSIMLRRVSRKPLRMPMRTKMCHCQTFCANGRLHDTFVNVNPQNTIATQFCDDSFTTIKADHRVLQHIYKEHFLIHNFLRLDFQIINLQP